ncbi:MAG TPA: SIR2 family protein, partial [Caulobacteraceae bacterium]|nr:SIR2 family protein [Caulobacteraceae bacterium]
DLVHSLFADVYADVSPGSTVDISQFSRRYNKLVLIRHLETVLNYSSDMVLGLRSRLYREFDERGAGEVIIPICQAFLMGRSPSGVSNIVTYNFDNALERALARLGVKDVLSVFSEQTYRVRSASLKIFHPHGFLPHEEDDPAGEISNQSATIFSERGYNEQFNQTWNWQNLAQLQQFTTTTCLFVGLSLADPNIRRLLDQARRHVPPTPLAHVSIQRPSGTKLLDNFLEVDLASLGVATLWVSDYDQIPALIEEIARA